MPETNWTWNDFWGAGWVNWHWSWNSTQQWGEVTRWLDMLRFSPLLPKTHSDQQFPPVSQGYEFEPVSPSSEAGFWGWAVATDVHVSSVSRWVYRRMFCACVWWYRKEQRLTALGIVLPSHGIICPRGVPALLFSLLSAAAEEGSYNLDPLHPHYWTFLPFFLPRTLWPPRWASCGLGRRARVHAG